MSITKLLPLIILSLLMTLQIRAESSYAQPLHRANQQITKAYLHHDNTGLLRLYADNAVVMPEFHITLFGKQAIAAYQRAWLDSVKSISYSRSTHDVTKTGDYLLETGTFSNHFSFRGKAVKYDGKYLNVWHIKPSGEIQLLWEISGSDKYLQRTDLPLSSLQVPDIAKIPKPHAGKITTEIQSLNDQVAELVVQRRGLDFANFYATDAIYAPYYMPMQIGKPAIDAYYREHEDPNSLIRAVHISASSVIAAGGYVLVDALYQVDWGGTTGAQGTVTGKNITIWKRMPDGRLLMFRQMTAHD